jgi:stage III sporulation protein SpoIIIAA
MKNKVPKLLQSSQDPEQVSLTVKSICVLLLPALMVYSKYSGVTAEQINDLFVVVSSVGATVAGVYGLIRKFK